MGSLLVALFRTVILFLIFVFRWPYLSPPLFTSVDQICQWSNFYLSTYFAFCLLMLAFSLVSISKDEFILFGVGTDTPVGLWPKNIFLPFSIIQMIPEVVALRHCFSSVQSLSCVWLFATSWIAARQACLSITNSRSSLKLTSIESVMPSSHLILCRPLSSPAHNPSQHQSFPMSQLFASGGQSIGVAASASEHPGLISFTMD